jgi:hypothetical protein
MKHHSTGWSYGSEIQRIHNCVHVQGDFVSDF